MHWLRRREGWLLIFAAVALCSLCAFTDFLSLEVPKPHLEYWPQQFQQPPWELNTQLNYSAKLTSSFSKPATPHERFYEFVFSELDTKIGGKRRKMLGINNQIPGPMIEAFEGETVRVRVTNKLPSVSTSLHFHGQLMNGSNYYDGASGVTQCGIGPGESFEYVFTANPAGTYWYHSHSGLQSIQGLVGPIIVHERSDNTTGANITASLQQDHALVLTDAYDDDPESLLAVYREPWLGGEYEPIPNIALAQGSLFPEITVAAAGQIRLRIVNSASYSAFRLQLGSPARTFQVIEADGTKLIPKTVTSLLVYPAQRYSILVHVNDQEWLFTTPQIQFYDADTGEAQRLERSSSSLRTLLRSAGTSRDQFPLISQPPEQASKLELTDTYFEPLDTALPPEKADIIRTVDLTMTRDEKGMISGAINSKIFGEMQERTANDLAQVLMLDSLSSSSDQQKQHSDHRHHQHHKSRHQSRNRNGNNSGSPQMNLDVYNEPSTVDIIVRNYDDGFHPMHLHGHHMWLLERGKLDNSSEVTRWDRPLKRDTIGIPEGEWMRLRVVFDNPGVWLFHCHIRWHAATGMATSIVALPEAIRQLDPPQEWWNLCKN